MPPMPPPPALLSFRTYCVIRLAFDILSCPLHLFFHSADVRVFREDTFQRQPEQTEQQSSSGCYLGLQFRGKKASDKTATTRQVVEEHCEKLLGEEEVFRNHRQGIRVTELDQADDRVQGERTRAVWGFQGLLLVLKAWIQHRNKIQNGKFLLSHWYNVCRRGAPWSWRSVIRNMLPHGHHHRCQAIVEEPENDREERILAILGIIGTALNLLVVIFVYIYTTF